MNTLQHHGIKGQRWGVRRYQDKNGRLTADGRKRYISDKTKGIQKDIDSYTPYLKTGIKAKDGKLVMTSKEVKDIVNGLKQAKSKIAEKYGQKYDKVAEKYNSKTKIKEKVKQVEKKVSNESMEAAKLKKEKLDSTIKSIFDKHKDLYDDFGGPDQIDDHELLALVMMEKGYWNDDF